MRSILSIVFLLMSAIVFGQTSERYLIKVGKLYHAQEKIFLKNQEILVVDGIIEDVGRRLKKTGNVKIIDLGKCTVTPGLIDMHTHLLFHQKQDKNGFELASKLPDDQRLKHGFEFAQQNLEAGITTVRDLGNSGQYLDLQLQKLLTDSKAIVPAMFVSGPILSPPGGQFGKLSREDSVLIKQEYREIRGGDDARARQFLNMPNMG